MKKNIFFTIFVILFLTSVKAYEVDYDFTAIAPSGQTLYCHINYDNTVTVYGFYWSSGEYRPSGELIIPDSVSYNGTNYLVTGISSFEYSSALTSVTIPNSVVTIKGEAFRGCSSLTSATIGNSVTYIGYYAFLDCSSLTSITIPNSVVTIEGEAFRGCSSLTSVVFNAINCNYESSSISYIFPNCTNISTVTIGDSVQSIPSHIFSGCSGITNITIPNSVITIGEEAFSNCSGLTSATIGNSVTSIGAWAFQRCSSLASITIPNSVTSIVCGAFQGCSSLTSATIGNSVTSIGEGAFDDCSSLTSITIPNSVTSIGEGAFDDCSSLTSITIPNSVTSIGANAFSACRNLSSVFIPNTVTEIGYDAFWRVRNIMYNGQADGNPWGALTLNGYEEGDLFYFDDTKTHLTGCRPSATNITIPGSVSSIRDYAFERCESLANVSIPSSVVTVRDNAFYGCTGLTEITAHPVTAPTVVGDNTFTGVPASIPVNIPCGSLASYSTEWSYFMNFVECGASTESIEEVAKPSFEISSEQGAIVAIDATGESVRVFDVAGRMLHQGCIESDFWHYKVRKGGVYLVQIGDNPAQKVLVLR